MQLENRKALVTGAAGGIGQAIVARLQAEGAMVAASDLDLAASAANVLIPGDLRDTGYADGLAKAAHDALGGLDIVVNNAGIITRGAITETTDDDLARTMAINFDAPFRICRAAIPLLEASGGGAIVNTSSCWGVHPGPAHPLYCASKAAVASLTQCLARDHAHQKIRVNAVCPLEVDTPMLRTGFEVRGLNPDTAIADLDKSVPLGRIAQPEDIADVVLFLVSDASRYMCGSLVEVTGGKAVH